jgi:hypothetical protein
MSVDGPRQPLPTPEPALFKNSLRLWQERWKAQQGDTQAPPVLRRKMTPKPRRNRRPSRS